MKRLLLLLNMFSLVFCSLNAQEGIRRHSDLKKGIFHLEEATENKYQRHKETVYLYVSSISFQVYYIGAKETFLSEEFSKSFLGHVIKDTREFKVSFEKGIYCVYIQVEGKFKKFVVKESHITKYN